MGADYYADLFDPIYAGKKWIIVADAAAGTGVLADRLVDAGAEAVMVVAGTAGTGIPPPAYVDVFVAGVTATTMMGGIRSFALTVTDPPPALVKAVAAFDPVGEAHVLTSYLVPTQELCSRPVYGGARSEWKLLEDKLLIEQVWADAGINHAEALIVEAANSHALSRAVEAVGNADGAVIVADNKEGWHGGAEYTRYLAAGIDHSETYAFFERHARRVRVMPFLQGVPCSIHGLVTADTVSAFRPVEMVVYRRPASPDFVYSGMATLWDPPNEGREAMRQAIRSVGAVIRADYGYRGAFGIDGVYTDQGFLPTELNPRLSGGLGLQAKAAGGYPIGDINRAVIAGLGMDLRLASLEQEIVTGADGTRSGRWSRPLTHLAPTDTTEMAIRYRGGAWQLAESDEQATLSLGPSPQGALVAVQLADAHLLPIGEAVARTAAASFAFSDGVWDTRIGPLIAGTASYR